MSEEHDPLRCGTCVRALKLSCLWLVVSAVGVRLLAHSSAAVLCWGAAVWLAALVSLRGALRP